MWATFFKDDPFVADGTPKGFYEVDPPEDAVEITDEDYIAFHTEQSRWVMHNGVRTERQVTPAEARKTKLAQLAAKRYEIETQGVSINGTIVRTDRESQALVTGAWARMQQFPGVLIDWKGESGWVQIDKPTMEAIAAAVGSHVQASFSAERAHTVAIMALPDDAAVIAAYDITTDWPA